MEKIKPLGFILLKYLSARNSYGSCIVRLMEWYVVIACLLAVWFYSSWTVWAFYTNWFQISNVFIGGMVYLSPLTQAMVYTWVQGNVDNMVTFYFVKMKACYLPFLMILVSLLLEGTPGALVTCSGYIAGHMYLFCDTLWPLVNGGRKLISTPRFLHRWIPANQSGYSSRPYGTAFRPRQNEPSAGASSAMSSAFSSSRFQGKGRRLGDWKVYIYSKREWYG